MEDWKGNWLSAIWGSASRKNTTVCEIVGSLDRLVPSKMVPTSMMGIYPGCHCNWSVWPSAHHFSYLLICAQSSLPWTVNVSCAHHSLQTSTAQSLDSRSSRWFANLACNCGWFFGGILLFSSIFQGALSDGERRRFACLRTNQHRSSWTHKIIFISIGIS